MHIINMQGGRTDRYGAWYFHPTLNSIARLFVLGGVVVPLGIGIVWYKLYNSPYSTGFAVAPNQPIPFSHKHHVTDDGIDCRYCHMTVERSSYAGMPSTETCMNCHSEIWTTADVLQPVRDSFTSGQPIRWNRVYNLPEFVHFDHSIHIAKGVGCSTCHGWVDQMPMTYQANNLSMEWCISCHRAPASSLRTPDEIFNMQWREGAAGRPSEKELFARYRVKNPRELTTCSVCHY